MVLASVIMPIYNAEFTLENAVESVLRQRLTGFELILINDGSTDRSGAICDAYEKKDKRIRVFHQENAGRCAARNLGIQQALGKYVTFIDNDDMYRSNLLSDQCLIAEKYDADIVKFGHASILKDHFDGRQHLQLEELSSEDELTVISKTDLAKKYLQLKWRFDLVFVWDKLFKREFLLKNNIMFDVNFKRADEDQAFCMQAYSSLDKLIINPNVYYCYIESESSQSKTFSIEAISDVKILIQYEKELFDKIPVGDIYPNLWMERMNDYLIRIIRDLCSPSVRLSSMERMDVLLDLKQYSYFKKETVSLLYDSRRYNLKKRMYIWLFLHDYITLLNNLISMDRVIKSSLR